MRKEAFNKSLGFKKYLAYSLTLLAIVAGLIFAISFEANTRKQNSVNLLGWQTGECPDGLDCSGPSHSKKRKDNGDGTYKLSLDVKGEASTTTNLKPVNVLIIYDVSGSMETHYQENYGSMGYRNYTYIQLYRSVNGSCVAIKDTDNYTGTAYRTRNANGTCSNEYTGNRYLQYRSYATEKVVHDFSKALLDKNQQTPNTVQMALVTFSGPTSTNGTTNENNATEVQNWTNEDSFADRFSDTGTTAKLDYGGGTNWEAAMRQAYKTVQKARKDVPTYVVFVTDGAPTFRLTNERTRYGNGNNEYSNYGHGTSTFDDLVNYRKTIDEVTQISSYSSSTTSTDSNTTMYGIYAFGNEGDLLDDLIYAAHNNGTDRTNGQTFDQAKVTTDTPFYYKAENEDSFLAAMNDIFSSIADTLGVGEVSISDGTTANVATSSGVSHLLEVEDGSYEYWLTMPVSGNTITRKDLLTGEDYTISLTDNGDGTITATSARFTAPVTVTGELSATELKYQWNGATELYNFVPPTAEFNKTTGAVDWDLSKLGTLLNDVTYTVTFNVYPSQETYDLVADLKNGTKKYSDLDENIRKYLGEDYSLETNTTATLTYSDTRPESAANDKTVYYNELDAVPLVSSKINVEKIWNNKLDERAAVDENGNPLVLDMYLVRDDEVTKEKITVSAENSWKDTKNISTGLIRAKGNETSGTLQVLDPGYDYTLQEPSVISYNWELTIEISHPMLINSSSIITTLVEVPEEDIPTEVASDAENTYRKVGDKTYYKFKYKD